MYDGRFFADLVAGLPDDVRDQVGDDIVLQVSRSLNGALAVAERYRADYPELSAGLVRAAGEGWIAGQDAAMVMGGLVCLVLAGIVYRFLPRT